jgi:large subunit ribosomal protein L9
MEVILKEDVPKLGHIGDVVKVKPGFARNFLLPRGLAIVADPRNVKALEHQKRIAADRRQRERGKSETLATQLAAVHLTITARAGEEGKLFGSVTNQDIERALLEKGVTIERRRIRLDEPIKALGDYKVPVHLAVGIEAQLSVAVVAAES